MTSVIEEVTIAAAPDDVWAALRDFGALHTRLAAGFVVDSRLDGDDGRTRIVTFANGATARETLVGLDEASRRLCYTVVEGPLGATHHSASAQVFAEPDGSTRFVWTTDVLPDELGDPVRQLMQQGLTAIAATLTTTQRTGFHH